MSRTTPVDLFLVCGPCGNRISGVDTEGVHNKVCGNCESGYEITVGRTKDLRVTCTQKLTRKGDAWNG